MPERHREKLAEKLAHTIINDILVLHFENDEGAEKVLRKAEPRIAQFLAPYLPGIA